MPSLSPKLIARAFLDGDHASTAHARGAALEKLLIHLFEKIPGVRLVERDVRVAGGSEEIDLVFWNDRIPAGLPFLPNLLFFECKNWTHPVDSASVVHFINKIRTRHVEFGFLVASNGITGDETMLTAARQHVYNALVADNIKILLVDRLELCGLTHTKWLIALLQNKIAQVILRAP